MRLSERPEAVPRKPPREGLQCRKNPTLSFRREIRGGVGQKIVGPTEKEMVLVGQMLGKKPPGKKIFGTQS